MSTIRCVAEQADIILAQCASFVQTLPDSTFTAPSSLLRGGTIGKHLRHTLDHYRALIEAHSTRTVVDYDCRQRGVPVESDRAAALDMLQSLRRRLADLAEAELESTVRIRVMLSGDGCGAELETTVARELAFASHHAIHHSAMMKAIALEFGVEAEDGFGIAPSTLNFQAQQ